MTLLFLADTVRSADLFHAVPVPVIDPFPFVELDDGRRVAVMSATDREPVGAVAPDVEVIDASELGRDELVAQLGYVRVEWELLLRVCRRLGVSRASVPHDFPVGAADHLRAGGIELAVDLETFAARRRVKTPRQLEGIRRAAGATVEAMGAAAKLIREAAPGLTCEQVRSEMQAVCDAHGATLEDDAIVARGAQAALGHESGSGPIRPGDAVLVDLWPRDRASHCWADMTRTFVAGGAEPGNELRELWTLTRRALDAALVAVRPGASGRTLHDLACEVYEAAGQPTQRTKPQGEELSAGFFHALGHGVGLEVHEAPALGMAGEELVAGDVVAIEPGCYRPGFGGCRLEDLVLVTEDGPEILTPFPYDL